MVIMAVFRVAVLMAVLTDTVDMVWVTVLWYPWQ